MKRRFRLTRSTDFKRVRRLGKSYAHPLVVLIALPNEQGGLRIGVAAGRSLGNAVERNRAKRLIRAVLQPELARITRGWDIAFIARQRMVGADFMDVQRALSALLRRACLLQETHDN